MDGDDTRACGDIHLLFVHVHKQRVLLCLEIYIYSGPQAQYMSGGGGTDYGCIMIMILEGTIATLLVAACFADNYGAVCLQHALHGLFHCRYVRFRRHVMWHHVHCTRVNLLWQVLQNGQRYNTNVVPRNVR